MPEKLNNYILESKQQDIVKQIKIKEQDIFTVSGRVNLSLKRIKGIIKLAVKKANGMRVPTNAYFFGDNSSKEKESRSWHVAVTRELTEKERYWIEKLFNDISQKANLGSKKYFFKWGVKNKDGYLEKHFQCLPQYICSSKKFRPKGKR